MPRPGEEIDAERLEVSLPRKYCNICRTSHHPYWHRPEWRREVLELAVHSNQVGLPKLAKRLLRAISLRGGLS